MQKFCISVYDVEVFVWFSLFQLCFCDEVAILRLHVNKLCPHILPMQYLGYP